MIIYLSITGRTQQTKYASTLSNPIQTTTGVPQGGLLSTTLFNIYINCLLNKLLKNCAIAYADDVTLLCSSKNMADVFGDMQVLLNEICSWAILARLMLNVGKCFSMFIRYAQAPPLVAAPTPALYINGSAVQVTTGRKILGVTITSTLNSSVHADQVRTKISRMSGVLQRFGCTLDSHTRLRIFNAFILPNVLYCLPVWGNLPTSHCDLFNSVLTLR